MNTHLTSTPARSTPAVAVRDLVKTYPTLDATITAAAGIDLDVSQGSAVAVTGASGSGKSTLLHLIGALDRPDEGTITVHGTDVTNLRGRRAAEYRRGIGFIFQRFNLLPTLSVLDNVTIPQIPVRHRGSDPRARARELLAAVGLSGREQTLATRLSGGQQQRVAIARALINQPRLLLADEPTGNLDSVTGSEIIDLLMRLRDEHDTTVLIATHDIDLAKRCDDVIHIKDGRIRGQVA